MRVYIVIDHDVEHDEILGVYADKDAAGDAQNRNSKDYGRMDEKGWATQEHYKASQWMGATIEVWEVQE